MRIAFLPKVGDSSDPGGYSSGELIRLERNFLLPRPVAGVPCTCP